MRIADVAIQRCHTNSPEDVYIPRAKKHPHFVAFLLKLHATAPVRLCPIDAAGQNPRIHPFQDDGLKQAADWMQRLRGKNGANVNTNQDIVPSPRDIHVNTDSTQSKLRLELVTQLITSAQTKYFNEGRNFFHQPKILVHCTSLVDNDVLGIWVLPVSHDQRSRHYLRPLSPYVCWIHSIPLIIQHFTARRVQPQTLVAEKMFAVLGVPHNFVVTLSQHRDVLATNKAIEMAGICRNICGPSHKELPNTKGPQAFFTL